MFETPAERAEIEDAFARYWRRKAAEATASAEACEAKAAELREAAS